MPIRVKQFSLGSTNVQARQFLSDLIFLSSIFLSNPFPIRKREVEHSGTRPNHLSNPYYKRFISED